MPFPKPKPLTQEQLTEARIQQNCLVWLNRHHREVERWYHSIPNGTNTDEITAARQKSTGLKSGVSDTFLPEPRGAYHGLYVEYKTPTGTLSQNQKDFIKSMRAKGYCCVVLDNQPAFESLMGDYLPLTDTQTLPIHHFTRYPL
ncbi:VRR-NUC domain-containing protein [Microvirga sp. STS02]|uniref:VRR-NUC domain-containing protein n=1 Tax=Hymenobacter negativus TaxID=2795026 RepID=UPI0018DE4300|nr:MULTISPECIES: VRR-NUC domain-containing protein [Bacteria]MBH8567304.1 VRR-NUC domain-containing protein [Hymenobacter negativus]MBR7207036.1 VRR-NUC domain-containing protein [Microvirga sp. STS02]